MIDTSKYDSETLNELLTESAAVEVAVRDSVREALLMHRRIGNPIATWHDGEVVLIPADQIPIHTTLSQ
jgi:hypothetical protein